MNSKLNVRLASAAALAALLAAGSGCVSPKLAGVEVREPAGASLEATVKDRPGAVPMVPAVLNVEVGNPPSADVEPGPEVVGGGSGMVVLGPEHRVPGGETVATTVEESGKARALRVRLAVNDGEAESSPSTLKRALRSRVEGALASRGFTVVADGDGELQALVDLRARRLNSRGSRVVWCGDADARVERAREFATGGFDAVLAREWHDVKGSEARSDDDAQKELASLLAEELPGFVAEAAGTAAGNLQVRKVTVRNIRQSGGGTSAYAAAFVRAVSGLPGVYRCEVLETRGGEKLLLAEIVYDGAEVEEGLANRIANLPGLGFGGAADEESRSLRLADVTVQNGWAIPTEAAPYAARFVQVTGKLPGVCWSKVLSTDPQGRVLRVAVLFDEDKVPEGLENRIRNQESLGFSTRSAPRPHLAEVTLRNAWHDPEEAPGYATHFVSVVSKIPGISSCRLLETDAAGAVLRAEVSYEPSKMPEGLENRLRRQESLGFGRPYPAGMRIARVTVQNAWRAGNDTAAAEYAAKFARVVGRLPGVQGCRIVRTDASARILQAEVFFDEDQMPEGLANRILMQKELGF